jgi:hypothetical protein
MKPCVVCGEPTEHPISAALEHFRLVEWDQWQFWRGNIRAFGFWSGLLASVDLSFPIVNTLRHWKYRKWRLKLKF